MAKARRKRKPNAATGKRQGMADLLDIAPRRTAKTPAELRKRNKMLEELAQKLVRGREGFPEISDLVRPVRMLSMSLGETKNRLRPQQELCWRVFRKLFSDGRIPDEVELSTTSLKQMIATELEREAKQTGKKPLRTPSWDVVRAARRNP
jgi:hypothetical protein